MGININMEKTIKRMLLEAELKNVFSNISQGKFISILSNDGKRLKYQVISNISGRIIMKDVVTKVEYVMDNNALIDGELIINRYDKNGVDFKNKEDIKLDIKKLFITDKNGESESIDINSEGDDNVEQEVDSEIVKEFDDFKNKVGTMDVDDILIITNEGLPIEKGDDSVVNDLYFKLVEVNEQWLSFKLIDVKGNVDGEESVNSTKLIDALGDRTIYISTDTPFKIDNGVIYCEVNYKNIGKNKSVNKVLISNIIDVEVNNINKDDSDDGETDGKDKKYTEQSFYDWVNADKSRLDLFNKQPNALATVAGASPTGLYQLKNLIQKATLDNSYLTKGKRVTFRMGKNTFIRGGDGHNLKSTNNIKYTGRVVAPKVIQYRDIGRGHFLLTILEELPIDEKTFKVKVEYCDTNKACYTRSKNSIIKIINNE